MEETLNAHAKEWRLCKAWWTQKISELRKKRGKATRQNPAAYGEALRTVRRAIRRAKKTCWDSFVQKADKEQLWNAVRYAVPRLDGKMQTLVDEAGVKATSREERERMLIASAFRNPQTLGSSHRYRTEDAPTSESTKHCRPPRET